MVGPLPWHARRGVHEEVREGEGKKARYRSTRIEKEEEGEGGQRVLRGATKTCIVHRGVGAAPQRPFVETQLSQWLP